MEVHVAPQITPCVTGREVAGSVSAGMCHKDHITHGATGWTGQGTFGCMPRDSEASDIERRLW